MVNIKIAYIGGGSMAWARTFMTDLAREPLLGGEICLYDIDCEAAKRNEIIGNRITADARAVGKWRYTTVSAIGEALTGADIVVISILPGDFEHMRSDVHLPERLSVYQSVGDTTGPGGIIRALRTIPLFVGFAKQIKKYSPGAWVINYTNPMAVCVRALYEAFPEIKSFGCCHEVFGTQALLAAMLKRDRGETADRSDIHVNVLGLNHFTWFDRATWGEHDLVSLFARYSDEFYESGLSAGYDPGLDPVFHCSNRVKFDLFRKYGYIAAAGDRHLAEFMPGEIYLKNRETAENWGFTLTSVDWRISDREKKVKHTARLVSGEEEIVLKPSGEEGILLIKALVGLGEVVSNVNLPNTAGQIKNLPKDTVVETNAHFSKDNVRPVMAGSLPDAIYDLFTPHIENQKEVMRAALDCDFNAVLRAFERDPLLRGKCSDGELYLLAEDMIRNTQDILPNTWREVV
ncbi:MAG: alpha-glucosidase/alpha-galactosidase [Oscillospiraceae bacterium]|nr:alpha-glucosidase/alpha-galactosidase [Oscillospiraceae bacterium]